MNVIFNNTDNFLKLFKENLHKELQQNKELNTQLENINTHYKKVKNSFKSSLPIKLIQKTIFPPLNLIDSFINQLQNDINYNIHNKLQNVISNSHIKHMVSWTNHINIPQYYGGYLKYPIKNKKQYENVNRRDEASINNIENQLLPNIFFQSKYIAKDKNIEDVMDNFYAHIRNKFFLKAYDFNMVSCIDMRGVVTDGYNIDEEIEFDFQVQMRVKYFKDSMQNKVLYYKCKMKFDGDDRIISFTYDEA